MLSDFDRLTKSVVSKNNTTQLFENSKPTESRINIKPVSEVINFRNGFSLYKSALTYK